MAECFCRSSFCGLWIFLLSSDDTGEVHMGMVKIRDFVPKKIRISIRELVSEMSGRDDGNWDPFLQKWNGTGRTKENQKEKKEGKGGCG